MLLKIAIIAVAALAAGTAAANDRPEVRRLHDGAYEVRYDDGCEVTYNTSGRRGGSSGCRPHQVERADRLVQEDAASHGAGGLELHRTANGAGRVTFNDGCVVTYNREGDRSGSDGCHPRQVEHADSYVQRHW